MPPLLQTRLSPASLHALLPPTLQPHLPQPTLLPWFIAGTPSGLLVSRSATKGTRVFRLRRDDELLRLMLLGGSCFFCCFPGWLAVPWQRWNMQAQVGVGGTCGVAYARTASCGLCCSAWHERVAVLG